MSSIHMELTAKGSALAAKIEKGKGDIPLEITRIVSASSTSPDPLGLEFLSDLDIRQTARITRQESLGSRASIEVLLSNQGNPTAGEPAIMTGYELFQLGMGAIDPDEGEILYRISQYENSTWVPPATEMGWTINPGWNFVVGNATQVIVQIDPTGMATIGQLTAHINDLVMSGQGVHGIRFYEGYLQVWDGAEWINVGGGPGPQGSFSIVNGVLAHDVLFGTVAPNADANTLIFSPGFAVISGQTINLL